MAALVEKFREKNPLLDRLADAGTVDVESEHTTGDTAPAATLEHIARSAKEDRRILLLARPNTAEKIVRRIDEEPKCMRSFSGEDGVHRLYNANSGVRVGTENKRVYRPAGGQSVWLYHQDEDAVELRDSDDETLAWFDDPAAVFSDADAYPRMEDEIGDFSKWSEIKRPVVPPVAFGEGGLDRDMVDVIAVDDDGLVVLEDGEEIPLSELVEHERERRRSQGPLPDF